MRNEIDNVIKMSRVIVPMKGGYLTMRTTTRGFLAASRWSLTRLLGKR
jgi:hypothetical protein